MTYPPGPPGNPGYQPAQPPGGYGVSNPSFVKPTDTTSKLPAYLQVAVAVLGLAAYLASFGPVLTSVDGEFTGLRSHAGLAVPLAVLAALLAAAGLLPKAKNYTAATAVVATLGALLAIARTFTKDDIYQIGWGLWLVLGLTIVQAGTAVGALLLEAGVITAPAPKPRYDPYAHYGLPPGGGYYGQPGQPGQPSGHHALGHQPPPQQPGYPSYGGYPPATSAGRPPNAPTGPSTGGFGTGPQHLQQQGPPTPPTGFPSFSQPPTSGAAGSATGGQGQGSASSGPGQPPQGGEDPETSSSAPSGPTQP